MHWTLLPQWLTPPLGHQQRQCRNHSGAGKSNAVAVVNRARERFIQAPRDRIFVLIDAEQDDLNKALKLCNTPLQRSNKKKIYQKYVLNPSSAPLLWSMATLALSLLWSTFATYDNVLPILQKELSNYTKSDRDIFTKVGEAEGLQRALQTHHDWGIR